MKNLTITFFLLVLNQNILFAQIEEGSFEFEGLKRKYEVYLPGELKENMPLILSLHGYSENFEWYRNYTQLHLATDTAGYILVCPQAAINLTWNKRKQIFTI